jgi:hypothetical protein
LSSPLRIRRDSIENTLAFCAAGCSKPALALAPALDSAPRLSLCSPLRTALRSPLLCDYLCSRFCSSSLNIS